MTSDGNHSSNPVTDIISCRVSTNPIKTQLFHKWHSTLVINVSSHNHDDTADGMEQHEACAHLGKRGVTRDIEKRAV